MLKIEDQNEFDEKFDVYSLEEVLAEVRDKKVSKMAVFNLPSLFRQGNTLTMVYRSRSGTSLRETTSRGRT